MKKTLCAFIAVCMLLSFVSCAEEIEKDDSPLTMYVGLGLTGGDYYPTLQKLIYDDLGIEVKFVYGNTEDTTNAMASRIANYDLPADIVVTSSFSDTDSQAVSFLDLAKYTNIPDLFTVSTLQNVSVNGAVYQLPFATRLIGVEYNKTLFAEKGWQLPKTYADMVELKAKADAAGIKFAVSGGAATGHGFNYLFHLMGSQYLNTPDGNSWFNSFLGGESDISDFAAETDYFKEYVEAGFFGSFHDYDWNAKYEFSRERALFYYNIINDIYSYDGFQYTSEGKIVGAEYDANGNIKAYEDANGNAVLINNEYVFYDSLNEQHRGLQRYIIPGAVVLHDEYGSMPWISENGSSNCYTAYNCIYVALDKKLGETEYSEKLKKAIKVLEFMASEKAVKLYTGLYPDGYVALKGFESDDTRLYNAFSKAVSSGYTMKWYYNDFDVDSIVYVGEKVNAYIKGGSGITIDDINTELQTRNQNRLGGKTVCIAQVEETLNCASSAKLLCIANGLSLQKKLEENGINEVVNASVLPYTESLESLPLYTGISVVQEKFYKGGIEETLIKSHISKSCGIPSAIKMKGSELASLAEEGFVYTASDGTEYKYDYCVVIKVGDEINPDAEYVVALPVDCVSQSKKSLCEAVISAGETSITGSAEEGIEIYASQNATISQSTLEWK